MIQPRGRESSRPACGTPVLSDLFQYHIRECVVWTLPELWPSLLRGGERPKGNAVRLPPGHQSLLIDTGWPDNDGRDADRIG
jgi:hypothetical protein